MSTMQLPLVLCHCLCDFVGPVKKGSILSFCLLIFVILCFSFVCSTSTSLVIYQGVGESGSCPNYPRDTVDFEEQDFGTRYFDIGTQS